MMHDDDYDGLDDQGENLGNNVQRFEEMLRNHETYFFDADSLIKITDFYLEKFDYDKAMEVIKYGQNLHPDNTAFKAKEAYITHLQGNSEEALEMINQLLTVNPKNEDLYLIKGLIYNSLGMFPEGRKTFKELLSFTEFKEDVCFHIAQTYLQTFDYHGAIHYFKNCLFENKKNEVAADELSECFDRAGRASEGITYFQALIDQDPYNALFWFHLGQMYQCCIEYEKAINAYDYCILIDENMDEAYIQSGQCHMLAGNYEKAIQAFKQSFEYNTPEAFVYDNIAQCYFELGNHEESRSYFKKAVKSNPSFHSSWYGIGMTLSEEERWYEAIHYLKKAIELNSDISDYWFLLGDCERELGNFEEADEAYRKVIEMDPDFLDIWYEYPEFLMEQNRTDEALQYAYLAVKYFPNDIAVHLRYIILQYRNGNIKTAYSLLSAAINNEENIREIIEEIYPELLNDSNIQKILEQNN
ncbi:MAG: tetratricopeptide repeat protein [Bacteroidia bacterium]